MFNKLGVNWAGSLLGFLGVAFLPIPFLFYQYGERLRKHSSYAVRQYSSSSACALTNVKQPTDFFKTLEDEESKASVSDENKTSKSE
jgi:hypothetical protein